MDGAGMASEGDELTGADEERDGAAGGVEEGELGDLALVGAEVEGPSLVALVEDIEDATGGEGELDDVGGEGAADVLRDDGAAVSRVLNEVIEVELNVGGLLTSRAERIGGLGIFVVDQRPWRGGLQGEEGAVGGEDDDVNVAGGVEKRCERERLPFCRGWRAGRGG